MAHLQHGSGDWEKVESPEGGGDEGPDGFRQLWLKKLRRLEGGAKKGSKTPTVGLEPTTTRLRALRSAD